MSTIPAYTAIGFSHRLTPYKFAMPQFERDQKMNVAAQVIHSLAVLFQHPLDGPELADHFADTQNGGAAFFFWMLMVFVSHTARVSGIAALVKNGLRSMGYGGICHGS